MYINSYGQLVADDYLAHHGILGMHWGIRRYQPYPGDYHGDGKFVGKKAKKRQLQAELKDVNARKESKWNQVAAQRSSFEKTLDSTVRDKYNDRLRSTLRAAYKTNPSIKREIDNLVNREKYGFYKIKDVDDAINRWFGVDTQNTSDDYIYAKDKRIKRVLDEYNSEISKESERLYSNETYKKDIGEYYDLLKQSKKIESAIAEIGSDKLADWQDKEIYKSDKFHDREIDKLSKKITKTESKLEAKKIDDPDSKKIGKLEQKIDNLALQKALAQDIKTIERERINGMSEAEMKAEKRAVVKEAVAISLINLINVPMVALGSPVVSITTPNIRAIKSNRRVAEGSKQYAQRAKQMHSSGMTYAEIAKKLGVSESSVSLYLNS